MNVVKLFNPRSTADILAGYGLPDEAVLKQALIAGHLAKSGCVANDALQFPAFLQWNTVQKTLREILLKDGWRRVNEGMYALVVSPDGKRAIVVASGDEFTGIEGVQHPTTKCPKGPRTVNAVQQNALLYHGDFFPETLPQMRDSEIDGRETWILLFNTDNGVLRAEISRPGSIGGDGHINAWQQRVILSEAPLSPALDLPETPDYAPTEDIEITRKQ